jgi:hypothetical protein
MLGDALEHRAQVQLWVQAVQFRRAQQTVDRGGPLAARIRAGKEKILAPKGQSPNILPISGRRPSSTTDGILCMAARFDGSIASGVRVASLFISRNLPAL